MAFIKHIILGFFLLTLAACSPDEVVTILPETETEDISILVDQDLTSFDEEQGEVGDPTTIDLDRTFQGRVVDVVDGDTLKVEINGKVETIRLLLVDTPETVHPRKEVEPFGPEASQFVRDWLLDEEVTLEADINLYDKYNRLLFYVYDMEGKSLQEELLKRGLARVAYVYPPNVKYVDQYRDIQSQAQLDGLGIWSLEDYALEESLLLEEEAESDPNQAPTHGLIKGNINSDGEKIYHVPGQQHYNQTVINPEEGERYFETEEEAVEAGWRRAKR